MSTASENKPEIVIRPDSDGRSTRVDLMRGGKSISRLSIVPFTLRIGAAAVRMDGIGGVGTDAEHRNRGYSRQVLEAAVAEMKRGDASLSMLYGIRDFYPKFGYATAGPDHLVSLNGLDGDLTLPAGWGVRPFTQDDLLPLQRLYSHSLSDVVGGALRPQTGGVWSELLHAADGTGKDECRVVTGPDGKIHGYLWRARWCWYVKHKLERDNLDALVLGEVLADSPVAADAVLKASRQWANAEAKTKKKIRRVLTAFPPHGHLAAAAMRLDSHLTCNFSECGGSMARVLNVTRLLKALLPELQTRMNDARNDFAGTLHFQTDMEEATLQFTSNSVTLTAKPLSVGKNLKIELLQSDLARLALSAFPPEDILARLSIPPDEETTRLLSILFPLRHPHMNLPDRY